MASDTDGEVRRVAFTCDAPSLISEALQQEAAKSNCAIGFVMGLGMVLQGLEAITKRAVVLGDAELLDILEKMSCVGDGVKFRYYTARGVEYRNRGGKRHGE